MLGVDEMPCTMRAMGDCGVVDAALGRLPFGALQAALDPLPLSQSGHPSAVSAAAMLLQANATSGPHGSPCDVTQQRSSRIKMEDAHDMSRSACGQSNECDEASCSSGDLDLDMSFVGSLPSTVLCDPPKATSASLATSVLGNGQQALDNNGMLTGDTPQFNAEQVSVTTYYCSV